MKRKGNRLRMDRQKGYKGRQKEENRKAQIRGVK